MSNSEQASQRVGAAGAGLVPVPGDERDAGRGVVVNRQLGEVFLTGLVVRPVLVDHRVRCGEHVRVELPG